MAELLFSGICAISTEKGTDMSNKKLSGCGLVIQLTRDKVRIAKMELGSADPKFLAKKEFPAPDGAVEDGFIQAVEPLRALLEDALADPELSKCRRVVFSLCSTQVLSEITTIPAVPAYRLDKLLQTNMDVYFPVEVQDYHLVWNRMGEGADENGQKTQTVQLWAVPKSMLMRYYVLANACGLTVAAVDFFGNSMVSFLGVGQSEMARPWSHSRKEPQKDEAAGEEPVLLSLLAEQEHLLMTFVLNGCVTLQRVLLCGPGDDELREALMVWEYFRTLPGMGDVQMNLTVCGERSEEPDYLSRVEEAFGISPAVCDRLPSPAWCVCCGAAKNRMEFGMPELDHSKDVRKQLGGVWQYGLVLAGGILLAGSIVLTAGSSIVWKSELNGLDSNLRKLQMQAAQNQGSAAAYHDYEKLYRSYSEDWDAMFRNLNTTNNNLSMVLSELEDVMPKGSKVTGIGVSEAGMGFEFACKTKNQAAQLIMALRDMQYCELTAFSDVEIFDLNIVDGQLSTPKGGRPSDRARAMLQFLEPDPDGIINVPAEMLPQPGEKTEQTDGTEQAPTEGGYDLASLLEIAQQATQQSGSTNYIEVLEYALSNGMINKDQIKEAFNSLTPEEIMALEEAYGTFPTTAHSLDSILPKANLIQKSTAFETMLSKDPFAAYHFYRMIVLDLNRPAGTRVLADRITPDLAAKKEIFQEIMNGDPSGMDKALPEVMKIIGKDEDTMDAAIKLIREEDRMEKRYAYYLAVELGMEQPKPDVDIGLDTDQIIQDIITDKRPDTPNKDKVDSALDKVKDSLGLKDELLDKLVGDHNKPSNHDPIGDLISQLIGNGNKDIYSPQSAKPTASADNHYFFSVALRYKPELIELERERKGMSVYDKLQKLEVEP